MNRDEAEKVAAQLSVDEKMAWVRLLMDGLVQETGESIFDLLVQIRQRALVPN